MPKMNKEELAYSKDRLRELVKPGDTVYTTLRHVSRSGMYRVINLTTIKDNEPLRLSGLAADLLEGYDEKHEGCRASGAGMDMGFHLVYSLSSVLWPEGFNCIGEKCPSNDHSNGMDREKAVIHKDGGYALIQRWLN